MALLGVKPLCDTKIYALNYLNILVTSCTEVLAIPTHSLCDGGFVILLCK